MGLEITGYVHIVRTEEYRQRGHSFMDAFLYILVVALLIIAGVVMSVRLYTRGAIGAGRFKRIRRMRSLRPGSFGTAIEETVEEEIDEEVPV
jgi:hypothetical protein